MKFFLLIWCLLVFALFSNESKINNENQTALVLSWLTAEFLINCCC